MHLRDLRLGARVVVQKNKAGTVKSVHTQHSTCTRNHGFERMDTQMSLNLASGCGRLSAHSSVAVCYCCGCSLASVLCRFLGRTKFAKDDWVGVELDHAAGKHDGAVEGVRYFQCSRNNTGVFVRANDCELEPPPTPERRPSTATHSRGSSQPASPAHARGASNQQQQQASTVAASSEHDAADDEHTEGEASDIVGGSPAAHTRGGHSHSASGGSRHFRSSSDLARVELEALLAQPSSTLLRNKKGIVRELNTKIARRPTHVEMIKSGIINDHAAKRRPKSPGRMKSASASGSQTPSTPNANAGWAQNAQADPSKPQRRMYVFGENAHGELSTGDEIDCFKPTEIKLPNPRPTRAVAGSPTTPSAAAASSSASAAAADSTAAAPVPPAPGTATSLGTSDFAQVCLGLHHMVVLTWNNEVLTCGSWVANLLGTDDRANLHRLKRLKQFESLRATFPENPIISIGCGDRHTVALHQDGACESFGGTLYGKLGHRSSGASYDDSPGARDDSGGSAYLNIAGLQGQKVSQMDAGNWHTACCTLEGTVYTFGGGGKFYNQGQLGHGDKEDSMMPRRIERFGFQPSSKVFVVSICCGGYHTLALTIDRQVYSWGSASFGQLGLGSDNNETTPQLVTGLLQQGSGVGRTIGLAAGENHSLCVQADGAVYSWGYSLQGQCGHGLSANEKVPRKIHFFASRNINIVQVDAGWRHSIALSDTHSVYTFGHGDRGQLGLGDTRSHSLPQLVESLEGCDIKTVAAGGSHSLAFTDFFKAAQELVFLQKVRAFKDVKAGRQLPDLTGEGTPAPGSKAARDAARAKRLGYSASPSPKRSGSPSRAGGSHPTRADFGLASPNPLVPSDLKHLLREAAAEAGEEGAAEEARSDAAVQEALKRFSIDDDDDDENERKYNNDRGRRDEDEESDTEYPEDAQRPGESLKDFHARRAANRERRRAEKLRRALAGATSSTLAFADRSRAPVIGANGESLSIELVYSSQVNCVHRFLTFQSSAPEDAVNALLDAYEAGPHCTGPAVILKQTLITPGNTVARSQLGSEAGKASEEVLDHSYTYDDDETEGGGPARYTLMVILRAPATTADAQPEEADLWPAWADDFYRALLSACPDVKPGMQSRATEEERAKADLAQACFRELRPPNASTQR